MSGVTRPQAVEAFQELTGQASSIGRNLGLVGVGVVWVFRETTPAGADRLPSVLVWALAFLVVSQAVDLLQYLVHGAMWGIYQWRKYNDGVSDAKDLKAPAWMNRPAYVMFGAKMFALVTGYVFLGVAFSNRLAS